jgi:hypothetical protein
MGSNERDELIELIARGVEERSLLDLRGVMAKRKRDREDAQLRLDARHEQRAELGRFIRAFKSGEGRDPTTQLRRIKDGERIWMLRDVADLVDMGLISLSVTVDLTYGSISGQVEYAARLTKDGEEAIAEREAAP